MRFTKTPSLVGDLEHWQYDTFVVRWRDRELRADAFVTFALKPDGTIDQAKMQAVSPSTDFSFDFQDLLLVPIAAMAISNSQPDTPKLTYPVAKTVDQVDDFFGTKVADPYRWLESSDTPDARAWIDAENKVTFDYLSQIPERVADQGAADGDLGLRALRRAEPARAPGTSSRRTPASSRRTSSTRRESLDAAPEVLIDPNTLSKDGTVALGDISFTDDGRYMAYSLAASGSDWIEWRVRDVATAQDLPDLVKWSKFSSAAWLKDGSGFFYSRYDEPKGDQLQAVNKNQKVFFHKLGTTQDKDVLVHERPDKPDWGFGAEVTEDGRFLLIYQTEGTDNRNRIFVRDLEKPGAKIEPFLDAFDASYAIVGNDGDTFYVLTNKNAPRFSLVAIERAKPATGAWKTLIPEASGTSVLQGVTMVNDRFVTLWMTDAHHAVRMHGLDGQAGSGGRPADTRRHRRPDRAARTQGDVLLLRIVPLPDLRLPLRLRQREERGVQEARARLRPVRIRDGAGLLQLEGRHADPDVPDPQERAQEGRREPDAAVRLRRLQHPDAARVLAGGGWMARDGRRLRGGEPARRRRVRAGLVRRGPARRTSRTCSTTSSPRPST